MWELGVRERPDWPSATATGTQSSPRPHSTKSAAALLQRLRRPSRRVPAVGRIPTDRAPHSGRTWPRVVHHDACIDLRLINSIDAPRGHWCQLLGRPRLGSSSLGCGAAQVERNGVTFPPRRSLVLRRAQPGAGASRRQCNTRGGPPPRAPDRPSTWPAAEHSERLQPWVRVRRRAAPRTPGTEPGVVRTAARPGPAGPRPACDGEGRPRRRRRRTPPGRRSAG